MESGDLNLCRDYGPCFLCFFLSLIGVFSLPVCRTGGGSMLGDVNISAILDSFSVSYDKRVRPNYGGKLKFHFCLE